ncbi:MAG: hypothetical protein DMG04_20015 [Acidobacteria bacterium]|nr:MAG: hypothetical protein DMG04_20015 [Acidobacteriota bacterium]
MKKRVMFAASLAFVASGFHAVVPESVKTDAGLLSGTSAAAPGFRRGSDARVLYAKILAGLKE